MDNHTHTHKNNQQHTLTLVRTGLLNTLIYSLLTWLIFIFWHPNACEETKLRVHFSIEAATAICAKDEKEIVLKTIRKGWFVTSAPWNWCEHDKCTQNRGMRCSPRKLYSIPDHTSEHLQFDLVKITVWAHADWWRIGSPKGLTNCMLPYVLPRDMLRPEVGMGPTIGKGPIHSVAVSLFGSVPWLGDGPASQWHMSVGARCPLRLCTIMRTMTLMTCSAGHRSEPQGTVSSPGGSAGRQW